MTEIKEIDMDKYYVIEKSDAATELSLTQKQSLVDILTTIKYERVMHNKPENNYLVLNMDNEIDTEYFWRCMNFYVHKFKTVKIKDIAVDLVSAILKTKKE